SVILRWPPSGGPRRMYGHDVATAGPSSFEACAERGHLRMTGRGLERCERYDRAGFAPSSFRARGLTPAPLNDGGRGWGLSARSRCLDAVAQCVRPLERELRQRHRPAEQIALPELTTGGAEELQLLDGFDALRGGLDVETASEPGDRAYDRGAVGM